MSTSRDTTPTQRSSKDDALDLIRAGVQDLLTSDGWKAALAFRQTFHQYSLFNALLIRSQRPEATLVAGYKRWLQHGRQVQRGERSIKILAPITRKDKTTDETRVVGFRFVSVFDVEQTKGDPLPDQHAPVILSGDSDAITDLTTRLTTHLQNDGVQVDTSEHLGGANGTYTPNDQRIHILANLPPLQALKTLAHEAAHHYLQHTPTLDLRERAFRELEAETTAFLVLHAFGLDSSSYTFPYLAHWSLSDDLDDIIRAGDRASRVATQLTTAITPSDASVTTTALALA